MEFHIEHKTGDTFDYALDATTDDDLPFDLIGWSATSQVRDHKGAALVANLIVSILPNIIRLQASDADVATWPFGKSLTWDVLIQSPDGRKRHTATIYVDMKRGVTR